MWGKLSRLSPAFPVAAFPAAAILLLLANPARAEDPVSRADQHAIQGVIASQMDAFRHDDGTKAFSFATPQLQTMFGSPATFMGLVRRAYQPVYRPRSFHFGDAHTEGDAVIQEVALIGPDGLPHLALYTMEHEPDGNWKIAACQLLERPTLAS
jgi:hypothetical protein